MAHFKIIEKDITTEIKKDITTQIEKDIYKERQRGTLQREGERDMYIAERYR